MVLVLMSFSSVAVAESGELDVQLIAAKILKLHEMKGPTRTNIIWSECGKRLTGDKAAQRAIEYAMAIKESIEQVKKTTGEDVDPDYVVAILYRESSNNECIIGEKEINKLEEHLGEAVSREAILKHVKRWSSALGEGWKWCRENHKPGSCVEWCNKTLDQTDVNCEKWCEDREENFGICAKQYVHRTYPEYDGIGGWDMGVAQYRWPHPGFRERVVIMPDGRVLEGISLNDILDYRVAIQVLVEDLAVFKAGCREHHHKVKGVESKSEDVYFVHHHTGDDGWSEKYFRAINKHLNIIRELTIDSSITVTKNSNL